MCIQRDNGKYLQHVKDGIQRSLENRDRKKERVKRREERTRDCQESVRACVMAGDLVRARLIAESEREKMRE